MSSKHGVYSSPFSNLPVTRREFDKERSRLLGSTPRITEKEKQQFANAEFNIGKLNMARAAEKKSAGDLKGAYELYSKAIERFELVLSLKVPLPPKKSILASKQEAESVLLDCGRMLQEKSQTTNLLKP